MSLPTPLQSEMCESRIVTVAAFSATTSIDRREFGLTWNQVLETGGVMVGDRIDITIDIEAVRQAAAQVA